MRPLNIHPQNVPSPRICGSAALSEGGDWKGSASEGGEQLLFRSQVPTQRDSTTRLWQLQGSYMEIAGLPAALGTTTLYSMGAGENVICLGAAV